MDQKKEILGDLFGTSQRPGITDASSPIEFQSKMNDFYSNLRQTYGDMGNKLADYLKKNKEAPISHHVAAYAVRNAGICEDSNRFFNNCSESLNKMLHSWNKKKLSVHEFVQEYEGFVEDQENQVIFYLYPWTFIKKVRLFLLDFPNIFS